MKEFVYEDPTGGGDDITMIVPDWVTRVPESIVTYGIKGGSYLFERTDE